MTISSADDIGDNSPALAAPPYHHHHAVLYTMREVDLAGAVHTSILI